VKSISIKNLLIDSLLTPIVESTFLVSISLHITKRHCCNLLFFAEAFRSFFRNNLQTSCHLSFSDIFWQHWSTFFWLFQKTSANDQKKRLELQHNS